MNGPLKFLTARKILPLLDLLAKFKRVLACSCSPNFCVARKLAKQSFYFCSCSQKKRSARHARECSNARKDHSSTLIIGRTVSTSKCFCQASYSVCFTASHENWFEEHSRQDSYNYLIQQFHLQLLRYN